MGHTKEKASGALWASETRRILILFAIQAYSDRLMPGVSQRHRDFCTSQTGMSAVQVPLATKTTITYQPKNGVHVRTPSPLPAAPPPPPPPHQSLSPFPLTGPSTLWVIRDRNLHGRCVQMAPRVPHQVW